MKSMKWIRDNPQDDTMPVIDEQRKFVRLEVPLSADVQVPGEEPIRGLVRDISLGGCFIECAQPPITSSQCRLELYFDGRKDEMHIAAEAGIVRRDEALGVGVAFERLSRESTHHLQRLLLLNSGSATARIEAEMRDDPTAGQGINPSRRRAASGESPADDAG